MYKYNIAFGALVKTTEFKQGPKYSRKIFKALDAYPINYYFR
jgi:hypothetical protein